MESYLYSVVDNLSSTLGDLTSWLNPYKLLLAIIVLVVTWFIARIARHLTTHYLARIMPEKITTILVKIIYYTIWVLGTITALSVYGVNLSGLLVAGGIAGIVIGFASQTVITNLLSGLFLYFDKPFSVGDPVEIDNIGGVVTDITILSTRIRTWDGVQVRLPNEAVFKSRIKSFTANLVRRIEYKVGISYSSDINKAVEVIKKVVSSDPLVLVEPPPMVFVDELGDNSVVLTVRFWAPSKKWFDVKTRVLARIKQELDKEGIEIPFPQRVVWFKTPLLFKETQKPNKQA